MREIFLVDVTFRRRARLKSVWPGMTAGSNNRRAGLRQVVPRGRFVYAEGLHGLGSSAVGTPHLSWGSTGFRNMTLTRFITKNALRNKRRASDDRKHRGLLLLLTFMMTLWQGFYIDKGSAESTRRLVTRHRVSLTFSLPSFYRAKIRAIRGVVAVVPNSWLNA